MNVIEIAEDKSPQLGGTFETNGHLIRIGESSSATDDRLQIGANQDLQLYHDGSNSRVVNSTGALVFQADSVNFNDTANSDSKLQLVSNAGVLLYYDNAKKFETKTYGVFVNGDG